LQPGAGLAESLGDALPGAAGFTEAQREEVRQMIGESLAIALPQWLKFAQLLQAGQVR
jgi:hypothetical protein